MRLIHLRIPGIIKYSTASRIQDKLVAALLGWKAATASSSTTSTSPASTSPDPAIITAEFYPVYTCGRREIGTVSAEQQDYLRAGGEAEYCEALRGGQTTFHGPGQLVAYPVIDLRRHKLSPRQYVCLLEKALKETCGAWGIKGMTTENPGVWTTPDKKIAALGVHLRRNITSHGIGLNINTDLKWFDRIVACGLEGKRTTSFQAEGVTSVNVDEVADMFVRSFATRLNVQEIYRDIVNDVV